MGRHRESRITLWDRRIVVLLIAALLTLAGAGEVAGQSAPAGEAVIAWHVTIAPTWFDPSTAPPQITPFGLLYALHDAVVRPLPGQKMGSSLAESWTESPDGLVYEFKLRRGLKFHNGDPVTAEDVKFSFERYKGAGAKEFQARVRQVDIVDPLTVRFHLKEIWPDFMTFYGTTATAAGIVVPRKYLTQVGEDAFRKHPIGAGPYKFVSHTPGVGVVLEASATHWRRVPNIYAAWREKKLRGLFLTAVGNSGNAASRVAEFMYSKGSHAYGGYPDIDELFLQQARERDPAKREALLHRIQQLTIDRAMFAPIMDLRALMGVGQRVAEHAINSIPMVFFPSYEDMRLKAQ